MLGFRYLKTTPTTHVMQYKSGKLVQQGAGLSFFYFVPSSVVVQIPLASVGVPFVFNEVTSDFQEATIQGDITYRVSDPEKLAGMLDQELVVGSQMDGNGVIFSDGVEKDFIEFNSGSIAAFRVADQKAHLVVNLSLIHI